MFFAVLPYVRAPVLQYAGRGMRAWSWRHAVLASDLKATTRHVLLTISCHMSDAGESCFPSTRLLSLETGLSERAVCHHIGLARSAGWIDVRRHGYAGRRWARNEYRARWPDRDLVAGTLDAGGTDAGSAPMALTEDQCVVRGTDAGSADGTDPDDTMALTQGQSIESMSLSPSLSARDARGEGEGKKLLFSKGWTSSAQAEIRDIASNPATAHVAEHFLSQVTATLNPPQHVESTGYMRQLWDQLRPASPEELAELADEMVLTRSRDLPAAAEIAAALRRIQNRLAAASRSGRQRQEAERSPRRPEPRRAVIVLRPDAPQWPAWLAIIGARHGLPAREAAEAAGAIRVDGLLPARLHRYIGPGEAAPPELVEEAAE